MYALCHFQAATLKEAKRHLTELKQSGASSTAYGTASASLRFFFETVRGIEWKPVSALQKRMVEDMCLSGFSGRTQDSYVRSVTALTRHYGKSPDLITEKEIRAYFVHPMTCPRCESVMTFEQRYTSSQRLSFASASPRGPP